MVWKIRFDDAAKKDLARLDRQVARRIRSYLRDRVSKLEEPRDLGESLSGSRLGEFWKYRVGDYRIIAKIEDDVLTVLVVRIGHRSKIYK